MNSSVARLSSRRLCLVLAALACALVAIGAGAHVARAGTWYIYPTITNDTQATSQSYCNGHQNWGGCVALDGSTVVDGDWTANQYGADGGRSTVPAECNPEGSNCGDGSGPNPPNIDTPDFDAPIRGKGADGYFGYTMPDGNFFGLSATDDENGLGLQASAIPGCGAVVGQNDAYACSASYTNGSSANSPFDASFEFTPVASATNTAAGQVCDVNSTSAVPCSTGTYCHTENDQCHVVPAIPTSQWSETAPGQIMFLAFAVSGVSSSDQTTITDTVTEALGEQYQTNCEINGNGTDGISGPNNPSTVCWLGTLGVGSGNDSLTVQSTNSNAQVEILQEAEIPYSTGHNLASAFIEGMEDAILYADDNWGPDQAARSQVTPRLTSMRTSTTTGRQAHTAGVSRGSTSPRRRAAVTVSYHDSHAATTALRFDRARAGVRRGARCVGTSAAHKHAAGGRSCRIWTTLPGARVVASIDRYDNHVTGRSACKAHPRTRGNAITRSRRCHVRRVVLGHLSNPDHAGRNTIQVTRVAGHRLAPGLYRVTATATEQGRMSAPVTRTFTIR